MERKRYTYAPLSKNTLKEKSNILIESFIPLFPEESMGLFISVCLKIYLFMGEIFF